MKTRIISGLVASLGGVIILLFHKTFLFPLTIAVLISFMIYELFNVEKCFEYKTTSIICFIFALGLPFFNYKSIDEYLPLFLGLCLCSTFFSFIISHKKLTFDKLSFMLTSTLLISFSMNTLILLKNSDKENGLFFMILALLGAWVADTGAYFVGTLFGKHKLCPGISPKKTFEGLFGGTLFNAILFLVVGFVYTKINSGIEINYIYLVLLGIICSFLGLLGDLTASQIKRQCQIKDYGKIMPGHGGILDRFDSVLFVAPFMYLALNYINLIR